MVVHLVDDLHRDPVLAEVIRHAGDGPRGLHLTDKVGVGAGLAVGDVAKAHGARVVGIAFLDGGRARVHRDVGVGGAVGRDAALGHGGVSALGALHAFSHKAQRERVVGGPDAPLLVARERLAGQEPAVLPQVGGGGLVSVGEDELAARVDDRLARLGGGSLRDGGHDVVGLARSGGVGHPVAEGARGEVEAPYRSLRGVHARGGVGAGRRAQGRRAVRAGKGLDAGVGISDLATRLACNASIGLGAVCGAGRSVGAVLAGNAGLSLTVSLSLRLGCRSVGLRRGPLRLPVLDGDLRGVFLLCEVGLDARVVVDLGGTHRLALADAVHAQGLIGLQGHHVARVHLEVAHERLSRGGHAGCVGGGDNLIYRCVVGGALGQRQLEVELRLGRRGLGRLVEPVVHVGHMLGHLEVGHAHVGVLHAHGRGEQLVELEAAQAVAVAGRAARLGELHAVDAGVGIDDGQARPVHLHVLQHAAGAVGLYGILQVHRLCALGRVAPSDGGGIARSVERSLLQGARDVGQRVVDGAVGAESRQRAEKRAGTRHRLHAVVFGAGVHVHAVLGHDHLGHGCVEGVACGHRRLGKVVNALGKGRGVARGEAPRAVHDIGRGDVGRGEGVVGRRAGVHGVGSVAVVGNVRLLVQAERGARHRVARLVHLLDPQTVLDVGHLDHRSELAVEDRDGAAVVAGLGGKHLPHRAVGGLEVHAYRVLGLGAVLADAKDIGILFHIAGKLVDERLVAARERVLGERPRAAGVQGLGRADGTLAAQRPARHGVALECDPGVGSVLLVHDGEHHAVLGVESAAVGVAQRLTRRQPRRHERLTTRDVTGVQPLAADGLRGVAHLHILRRRHENAARPACGLPVLQVQLIEARLARRGIEARAVPVRDGNLAQHVVRDAPGRLGVEGDEAAARAQKGELAVIGDAGGNGRAVGDVVVLVGLVEGEDRAVHRVVVLVDLLELRHRLGEEVELDLHVRGARTALQVEEVEGVRGAVGQGVAAQALGDAAGLEDARQRAFRPAVDEHLARTEVDARAHGVVDAAHIAHEHAVDVDPHVVVARELEGHVVAAHQAIGGLREHRGHRQAEVVVERVVTRARVVGLQLPARDAENLVGRVEGEELSTVDGRLVVHVEAVGGGVVGRVVDGAVVDVISGLNLKEPGDAWVGSLAVLRPCGIGGAVEKVCEGLADGRRVGVIGLAGCEVGVAVHKRRSHDARILATAAAGPLVDAGAGARVLEPQVVPAVDALVGVVVDRRGLVVCTRDHPVVEQVDRRVRRIHRVYGVGAIVAAVGRVGAAHALRAETERARAQARHEGHEQHGPEMGGTAGVRTRAVRCLGGFVPM